MGNVPLKVLEKPLNFLFKKGTNPEVSKQSVPCLAFIICNKQFNAFSKEWHKMLGGN